MRNIVVYRKILPIIFFLTVYVVIILFFGLN